MKPGDTSAPESQVVSAVTEGPPVTRSAVPGGLSYPNYKQYLRHDFFCSCAYCTMSESEAQAVRFTIDHYEPRRARPELEHEYSNLMYACDECNSRKGDRCPPPAARADGHRFFRPDTDRHEEHFREGDRRIEPQTPVGDFTIEALDLNRLALRRLREIRTRLRSCHQHVIAGILGLRRVPIDRLPKQVKGKAARAIQRAIAVSGDIQEEIDKLLREYAESPLIETDPDAKARAQATAQKLNRLKALYPGAWRGRDIAAQ